MAQNIEIKARTLNFHTQIEIAKTLSSNAVEVLIQADTFFNVPNGRLKLREFPSGSAQLIFYHRADEQGPKLSEYEISHTDDPVGLKNILKSAYGVRNSVHKTRYLYIVGRTRIHFDQVKSLGEFIELEVVLADNDDLSEGEKEATALMKKLGIKLEHLVKESYVDLMDSLN